MRPFLIGSVMALVMLFMSHDAIRNGEGGGTTLGLGFLLAHVLVLVALGGAMTFVPALRIRIRAHKPSLRHMAFMLAGVVAAATLTHLTLHARSV